MMTDLMPGHVDAGTGNVVSGDEADLRACLGDLAGLVTGGRRLDNTLGEGPCITAALEGRTVRSGSLGREKTWPRFGPRVGRLGVHSALSLPLMLTGQVVGAINVYARAKDVFDDHAVNLGEQFALPAAVAVHNAQVPAQAQRLTAQLQTALSPRPVIDQAIGLLRSRTGGSAEEAFARLRELSEGEHTKLVVVAQRLVDEAVRKARARHVGR